MKVKQLIRILEDLDQDATVYIGAPEGSDYQRNHEQLGVRYVVNANEEVWFETYGDEDIGAEIDALTEAALTEAWSDNDLVDALFDPDEHGYTLEDIRKNCEPSFYYWCRDNEYRKEMYSNG